MDTVVAVTVMRVIFFNNIYSSNVHRGTSSVFDVLLFVLHVCILRECDGDGNSGLGMDKVWLW